MSLIEAGASLCLILFACTSQPIQKDSEQIAQRDEAKTFFDSGLAKYDSGDKKGAITDWDKVISINPNYTEAYMVRGRLKAELGDYQGGIGDINKARELFRKEGNKQGENLALTLLREIFSTFEKVKSQ